MNWTVKQYEEYKKSHGLSGNSKYDLKKYSHTSFFNNNRNKYRNRKREIDGHIFDSEREADVYSKLKMCEENGIIFDLELQPKFTLQDSFKDNEGHTHRKITYIADFRYREPNGHIVVIDVKSKVTASNPVYRLKKKMLLFHYPEIDFREVF